MKNIILFTAVILMFFSCKNEKPSINDFKWLEGKWAGTSKDLNSFEEWQPLEGNLLEGVGGGMSGTDTVFSEKIKIEPRGEDIFYSVAVEGNDASVGFKFTGYKNDSIIFENPAHDFPQRVVYYRTSNDKLYACVDGKDTGVYSRIEFSYLKSK